MALLDFPHFTREDLAELGGWTALRQARDLLKAGAVREVSWAHPELAGEVEERAELLKPTLNLRSLTFVRNECQCRTGRTGHVCPHALALILAVQRQEEAPPTATPARSTCPKRRRAE